MPAKTLCSNCMREFEAGGIFGDPNSPFGVCPECEEIFERQQGQDLKKYVDNLMLPTLVVNQGLRVIAFNGSFLKAFCEWSPKPIGLLTGELLGCLNALLAERCGGSSACLDCAIHRSALETLNTGKLQKNIRAQLTRLEGGRKVRRELLVSTDKLGDLIKITVDSFYTVLEPFSDDI